MDTKTAFQVAALVVPSNIEAEQAVLGALVIDPDAIVKVLPILKVGDFYLEKHDWIFEAAVAVHARHDPIDYLTLAAELEKRGHLNDVGGAAYITALINAVPTAVHVQYYAGLVRQTAVARQLISASGEIAGIGYDAEGSAAEMQSRAQAALSRIQWCGRSKFKTLEEIGGGMEESVVEGLEHPGLVRGVATGYRALDNALHGLRGGDLIVIAGRPGSGKSSLAHGIAINAARQGKRTAYFSLEMSNELMMTRTVCILGGFDSIEIDAGLKRNPNGTWRRWSQEEKAILLDYWVRAEALPIFLNDASSITTAEATADAAELAARQGVDLVVFDYLGLAGDRADNRVQQVGAISRGLKALARQLNVPVLEISQLNRKCEERADKKPCLADLRDSGDVEQDADVVIFIWRPKMYWKNETDWHAVFPHEDYPDRIATLPIEKNRHGPTDGHISMLYEEIHTRFVDIDATRGEP